MPSSKYRFTANLLTKTILLFAFFTMLISNSVGNGSSGRNGGCSKKDPNCNPTNCTKLVNTFSEVYLIFPGYIPGRPCTIPEDRSNPAYVAGSGSLNYQRDTYYCQISIQPNYLPGDCQANYIDTWRVFGLNKTVVVPYNRSFTLTVEFWERCENFCNGVRFEDTRAYWKFSTVGIYSSPWTYAYLNYEGNQYICK